jgi:DNA-directed RNA polymerase
MEWLSDSAVLISRNGRPVTWVTPMGLPVVQPYVKPKTITVETLFQSVCSLLIAAEVVQLIALC